MRAVSRRHFLATSALASLGGLGLAGPARAQKPDTPVKVPARAVTRGPKHHFFGYYDKTPWDKTGRYLLANEIDFADRQPRPGEELTIGMVDLSDGDRFLPLARTTAWCWQQGAMLQWLGSAPERDIIFNSFTNDEPTATVLDVRSGKSRTLPRPVYALSADGTQAVSLDFARLHRLRPGYGYASYSERYANQPAPEQLGIWWMDVKTGKSHLIISLKQLAGFKADDRFAAAHHWVNHLVFNPSGSRIVFLHRWKKATDRSWQTRMLTVKPDGTDLGIAFDEGMVSHFDWRDDNTILAWARSKVDGNRFYTLDITRGRPEVIGADVLTQDGHCSYSPDRKWILNDTYPDRDRLQWLMLYKVATGRRYDLNQFVSPKQYTGPWRCDLHPRWNRDGTQVCIDGCHDAQRQVYVLDVSEVVKS